MFAGIANSLVNNRDAHFKILNPDQVPGLPPEQRATLWVGELRYSFNNEKNIMRVWVNRTNNLPARIQFWETLWPEIAPEILVQEYEFTDFDANFPASTFVLDLTDADLKPLGITSRQLRQMPPATFSVHLTGEAGAEIVGQIIDHAGVQEVKGHLPFSFIHVVNGDCRIKLQMADGQSRNFGASLNNCNIATITARLEGKIKADGTCTSLGSAK
jgi:hypothetical protein